MSYKAPEKKREYNREYYKKNREKKKEYYEKNRDRIAERNREYYRKNRDKLTEYRRKYQKENREKIIEKNREYYEKNREKIIEKNREYYEKNRKKVLERGREYDREYSKKNPISIKIKSENYTRRCKDAIPNPKTGRYTDGEVIYLVKNANELTHLYMAIVLNRSVSSVQTKIQRLRKAGLIE